MGRTGRVSREGTGSPSPALWRGRCPPRRQGPWISTACQEKESPQTGLRLGLALTVVSHSR